MAAASRPRAASAGTCRGQLRRRRQRRARCAAAGAPPGRWDAAAAAPPDAAAAPAASLPSSARAPAREDLASELIFAAQAPRPIAFARKKLNQRLAVLLMRSTYEAAAEQAGVISEADFQRRFFLERQSAWQSYINLYSPQRVEQGDLTSPLYFDYLSAAQYATISALIDEAPKLPAEYDRVEYVPPDEEAGTEEQWVTRRARRDPALSDPLKLRAVVAANVGENILSHAETDFADAELAVPDVAACGADGVVCAYDACAALLRSLVDAGFALGCTVGDFVPDGEGGGAFTARLEGPATLWAAAQLRARRVTLNNDIDAFAVAALAKRAGFYAAWSTRTGSAALEREFVLTPRA